MSLSTKVDQFNGASDLVHRFVHADKNTDIQTQGGPVPSIAKLADVLQKRVIEVVDLQRVLQQMLAANSGAGLVKTSDGKTVQAALDGKANVSGSTTQDFSGKRLTAYNPGNSVYLEGGANGVAPALVMTGAADANVGLYFGAKGTGEYNFTAAGGRTQFRIVANPLAVNNVVTYGGSAGANPVFGVQGSDPNIGIDFRVKGSGEHIFRGIGENIQFAVTNTASAANFLKVIASVAGQGVTLAAEGTDTNVNVNIRSRGAGNVTLFSAGAAALYAQGQANGVNVMAVFNAAAGNAPRFEAVGADANISIRMVPRGTGGVVVEGPLSATGFSASSISLTQGAPAMHFFESDQVGAVGAWRLVADGGAYRLDMNTHAGRGFATYKTPWTVNANGVLTVPTPSNDPLAVANAEYVNATVNAAIAAKGGGVWEPIAQATITDPVAYFDYLTVFSSPLHDTYAVEISGLCSSINSYLSIRLASGGSLMTEANYGLSAMSTAGVTVNYNSAWQVLSNANNVLQSNSYLSGEFTFRDTTSTLLNQVRGFAYQYTYFSGSSTAANLTCGGVGLMRNSRGTISGFRLYPDAGATFTAGTIRIYGRRKA